MSGIYVPDMEKAKRCIDCEWCRFRIPGRVYICKRMKDAIIGVCLTDVESVNVCCPVVAVQEHGTLIDKDKLKDSLASELFKLNSSCITPSWNDAILIVQTAETVIPTDKEDS